LRRPPAENQEWRLDQILKRRAEAGVKIFVMVYREVEAALTCNSAHTKRALQGLCPPDSPGYGNIKIMRHPDHNFLENAADMTFYWAHHEKFIVIDYETAFIGGFDLCFGRWDDHAHALSDLHPEGAANEVWPGQDFNNNRVMDFKNVQDWEQNELNKADYGRMPWHDVSMGLIGPCVYDIAEHFVLRWNFIKRDKYKRDDKFDWLELQGRQGEDEDLVGVQRPKHPVGDYIVHPISPLESKKRDNMGTVHAQVVRSSADWSSGILTDASIQNAYIEVIRNAKHYVYIENQFFITATGDQQSPIHNQIGRAIVDAVVQAGKEGRKFRVIILIPAVPGFAGDLRGDAATGTRAIMDYQYKSICRGEHSIFEQVRKEGVDPEQHIFLFNLRSYDRLNNTPATKTEEATHQDEKDTGFKASVAHHAFDATGSVSAVPWDGAPETEVDSWIQEELYIHSKLLIADDRIVICGSSNLNDRSQLGYHDSELSIVLEDTQRVASTMDGQPFEAGLHAASLRRYLWREHLGLLLPQDLAPGENANARPPGEDAPNDARDGDEFSGIVEDPLSDQLWEMWTGRATRNTEIFRQLFHADPDNHGTCFFFFFFCAFQTIPQVISQWMEREE
jgi:phospholipase D1/2